MLNEIIEFVQLIMLKCATMNKLFELRLIKNIKEQ
jgi:hypothetical protein